MKNSDLMVFEKEIEFSKAKSSKKAAFSMGNFLIHIDDKATAGPG